MRKKLGSLKIYEHTWTVVVLQRSLLLELAEVTRCGEASVFSAVSDMNMLARDIDATTGVVVSDAPAPLNWDKHDTDHGRAPFPPRFLRSCT